MLEVETTDVDNHCRSANVSDIQLLPKIVVSSFANFKCNWEIAKLDSGPV